MEGFPKLRFLIISLTTSTIDVIHILPCSLIHHQEFVNIIDSCLDLIDLITTYFSQFHPAQICIFWYCCETPSSQSVSYLLLVSWY